MRHRRYGWFEGVSLVSPGALPSVSSLGVFLLCIVVNKGLISATPTRITAAGSNQWGVPMSHPRSGKAIRGGEQDQDDSEHQRKDIEWMALHRFLLHGHAPLAETDVQRKPGGRPEI